MFFKSLFSCDRYPNGEIFFFILVKHLVKCATIERSPDHWWVTTIEKSLTTPIGDIERSQDHWWVTTSFLSPKTKKKKLKGHQIFGELRQIAGQLPLSVRRIYCRHHQQRHLFSNYLSTSYSCTIRCIFQFQC